MLSLEDFLSDILGSYKNEASEGEEVSNDGRLVSGVYLPLTDVPTIGNFETLPGFEENYVSKLVIKQVSRLLDNLVAELTLEETDPKLLYLMDSSELKDIGELTYGMLCKIRDFKNKTRLLMKAKLLFEKETVDLDLSEEELIKILELDPRIDLQKITIDNIIKYYPNLVLDSIEKFKENKDAKKEESRGSSDSSTESKS